MAIITAKKGTLAGHSIAGDIFLTVYGDGLEEYQAGKKQDEECMNYNGESVDVSTTTFVDDIGEILIAETVEQAHEKTIVILNC